MTEQEFKQLVAEAQAAYQAMTPEQKTRHDYMQRRSFVRGMCPDDHDFSDWCAVVDRILPPMP